MESGTYTASDATGGYGGGETDDTLANRCFASAFCRVCVLITPRQRPEYLVLTELTKKSQKKGNYVGRLPVKKVASRVLMHTICNLSK